MEPRMPEYDNPAIAAILDTTADLLEIAGADRFRFLSYHKAAHAVRAWPEDINTLATEERLTDIPGVGKKLAANIASILARGSFAEFDELTAELPPTLVALMQVPGVGPKKARTLYDRLGVTSVDDLEAALAEGKVAALQGFGDRTAANIAAGIISYRTFGARALLADALPLAEKVAAYLRALPSAVSAEPAGSVRRGKETVGDIDVLVASLDPSAIMEAARTLPIVTRVIASGETKTSVETTAGLQVDVRVVAPDEWGAALQYFTGSAEHNVRVREIAKGLGLKVTEYGVFRIDTGERCASDTEEAVYAALGMQTPPPELRENAGEIESATAGTLPKLITLADIRGDLHCHTTATDGKSTLEANKAKAAELGYEYLAITDHAWGLRMVGGLDLDDLERQWARIDELNAEGGPVLLKSIELNIDEKGEVDYPDEVLARFDICIASLHSGWGQPREVGTSRLLRAMENRFVDIIGHPTGRILRRREPIDLDMEAVCAKAAETGTALEIDAYPDRLDLSDVHLRMALRHGARISMGCDAHEASQMHFMRYGVSTARRGWVTPEVTLNAHPLPEMLALLKRNRTA
ncbi:MAG: DNA polymerase/3'-5' exonuclease PolX [Actinobacteria bacterium HGW-Actinobacteria-1]|jgi:DNA polymerase (family 10)|nr:MAG: DNA polymerase/3'-5' exonuclease PolX [Actinobacteria bacterium HGW-Actinobacteria-1]